MDAIHRDTTGRITGWKCEYCGRDLPTGGQAWSCRYIKWLKSGKPTRWLQSGYYCDYCADAHEQGADY